MKTIDKISVFLFNLKQAIRYFLHSFLHLILPSIYPAIPLNPAAKSNAVLITGCSSGIGKHAAFHLASLGYSVFAGIRTQKDASDLLSSYLIFTSSSSVQSTNGSIIPVIIDVTLDKTIDEAVDTIRNHLRSNGMRLVALVNNAGVGCFGPIECFNREIMAQMFDINVFGVVNVTRAFLPLLRDRGNGGRVVNVGSVASFLTMISNGPYCASKHALLALNDTLRLELSRQSLHVSLVNPGGIKSKIAKKQSLAKVTSVELQDEKEKKLRRVLYGYLDKVDDAIEQALDTLSADPIITSTVIYHAVSSKFPQARYLAGLDAVLVFILNSIMPIEWIDALKLNIVQLVSK